MSNAHLTTCPICGDKFRAKGFPVHMAAHVRRGEAQAKADLTIIDIPLITESVTAHVNGASPITHVQQAIDTIEAQMTTLQMQREALLTAKKSLEA